MQGGGQQHIVQSPAGASGIDIGETSVVHEESVDGGNWQEVVFVNRSPGSRVFPSAVAHNDFLYIFGGHDGSIYRNDLLLFNLATRSWQFDLDISGDGPSPRDAHAAVIHGECMYVFGGYDSKRYLNDFHRFHFNTCTWSSVAFGGGAPSPRGGHTAVVHGQQTLVFGGCDGWNYFNDLFKFGFDTEQWLPVRVTGTAPGARSAPATVIHESQATMYIFGGYDGGRSLNDLFRFNLSTSEWAQVRFTGVPPSPRGGHTAVVHGDTMYAFGGKSGRSPFNDLHSFSFEVSLSMLPDRYDGRRYFDDCFEFPLQKPVEEAVLTLSGDLQPMVDNPQFSDVTFVVEGQQVHAHKFILYARSEYFRRMFTSGYREATDKTITIPDVSYDVFLAVLSYLYTGTSKDIDPQMACEVLGVANLYGIEPLKRTCADMMMRAITISNVASILQAADTYQVGQLRSHCISYMVEHFAEVVKSESFSELISTPTRPLVLLFLEEAASRMRLPSHTAMGSECE